MNQLIFSLKHFFLPPISQQFKTSLVSSPWLHQASWSLLPSFHPYHESHMVCADICIFLKLISILKRATSLPCRCPYHLPLKSLLTFLAPCVFSLSSAKVLIPQSTFSIAVAGTSPILDWGNSMNLWWGAPITKHLTHPAAISKLAICPDLVIIFRIVFHLSYIIYPNSRLSIPVFLLSAWVSVLIAWLVFLS